MRIIGEIKGTPYKITVFKMDHRYTLQFETGQYIQSFKLRASEVIDGLAAIEKFAIKLLPTVNEGFVTMNNATGKAMGDLIREQVNLDDFEEII